MGLKDGRVGWTESAAGSFIPMRGKSRRGAAPGAIMRLVWPPCQYDLWCAARSSRKRARRVVDSFIKAVHAAPRGRTSPCLRVFDASLLRNLSCCRYISGPKSHTPGSVSDSTSCTRPSVWRTTAIKLPSSETPGRSCSGRSRYEGIHGPNIIIVMFALCVRLTHLTTVVQARRSRKDRCQPQRPFGHGQRGIIASICRGLVKLSGSCIRLVPCRPRHLYSFAKVCLMRVVIGGAWHGTPIRSCLNGHLAEELRFNLTEDQSRGSCHCASDTKRDE